MIWYLCAVRRLRSFVLMPIIIHLIISSIHNLWQCQRKGTLTRVPLFIVESVLYKPAGLRHFCIVAVGKPPDRTSLLAPSMRHEGQYTSNTQAHTLCKVVTNPCTVHAYKLTIKGLQWEQYTISFSLDDWSKSSRSIRSISYILYKKNIRHRSNQ